MGAAPARDSRCPYTQVMSYVEKLAVRKHPYEVHAFPTGHSPFDIEEKVRQVRTIHGFLHRHVPGLAPAAV